MRNVVLALALAATLAGIGMIVAGVPQGVPLTIGAGIFTLLVLGESWRYRRGHSRAAESHFEKTAERYRDPTSGELMEVQYDPRTGARRYVRADQPPDQ